MKIIRIDGVRTFQIEGDRSVEFWMQDKFHWLFSYSVDGPWARVPTSAPLPAEVADFLDEEKKEHKAPTRINKLEAVCIEIFWEFPQLRDRLADVLFSREIQASLAYEARIVRDIERDRVSAVRPSVVSVGARSRMRKLMVYRLVKGGKSRAEVAQEMGVTVGRVSQMMKAAERQLAHYRRRRT